MKIPRSTVFATAVAVTLALRPTTAEEEVAPYVVPGRSVYGLVLADTQADVLPDIRPAEAIKIVGVQGRWALVEARGQARGPVWINFDQVVSYRTDP